MPNWPTSSRATVALARLDPLHEGAGSGAGDGAQRLDRLVAAHADAVVLDRQLPLVGIEGDDDARRRVVGEQRRLGDRLVAQLLAGIRGVGDQLAQKNVPVGIDRVNHQMQEPRNVSLETAFFRRRCFSHVPCPRCCCRVLATKWLERTTFSRCGNAQPLLHGRSNRFLAGSEADRGRRRQHQPPGLHLALVIGGDDGTSHPFIGRDACAWRNKPVPNSTTAITTSIFYASVFIALFLLALSTLSGVISGR